MFLAEIKETFIDTFRKVKTIFMGKVGVSNAYQSMPFGMDGVIPNGYTAILSDTSVAGRPAIIGVINKKFLDGLGSGEVCLFSTNTDGSEIKATVKMLSTGDIELNGNDDNAVKYLELKTAIETYLSNLNTAIATGVSSAGGAYVPPTPINLTNCKSEKVFLS